MPKGAQMKCSHRQIVLEQKQGTRPGPKIAALSYNRRIGPAALEHITLDTHRMEALAANPLNYLLGILTNPIPINAVGIMAVLFLISTTITHRIKDSREDIESDYTSALADSTSDCKHSIDRINSTLQHSIAELEHRIASLERQLNERQ
jgi:hypothetical protein